MKYTITSPETEARLATVDAQELETWDVVSLDEKGSEKRSRLAGASVSFANGMLELRLSEPVGGRLRFPAFKQAQDGVFVVATPLGTVRLLASRGVSLEGASGAKSANRSVKSSMPGKVLKVLCKVGETLEAGQPMFIIEAMKMENEIRSPQAGRVEEIGVQPGQSIQTGDLLVKLGQA